MHRQRSHTLGAILILCGVMIFSVAHIAAQQPVAHAAVTGGTPADPASEPPDDGEQLAVAHAECSFFGESRDASASQLMKSASVQFLDNFLRGNRDDQQRRAE